MYLRHKPRKTVLSTDLHIAEVETEMCSRAFYDGRRRRERTRSRSPTEQKTLNELVIIVTLPNYWAESVEDARQSNLVSRLECCLMARDRILGVSVDVEAEVG